MKQKTPIFFLALFALFFLTSCAVDRLSWDFGPKDIKKNQWARLVRDRDLAKRILALDPDNISAADIKNTLSKGPAPWILPISPAFPGPVVFKDLFKFLVDMGYPAGRFGDPRDGGNSVSFLESSESIAGMLAWAYERDGMAPMMVGWSAGAIMTISVLHDLNKPVNKDLLRVVNGLTGEEEERNWIWEPYSGKRVPMIGSERVSFAGVLTAGGLGRFTQFLRWDDRPPLRSVPDSVKDLIAFQAPNDMLGTDFTVMDDLAAANEFKAMGKANVRTIIADDSYGHVNVIHCYLLSDNKKGREWANYYHPDGTSGVKDFRNTTKFELIEGKQNLWCGEFWYGVKKNWTLQAQRVARAVLDGKIEPTKLARARGLRRLAALGIRR